MQLVTVNIGVSDKTLSATLREKGEEPSLLEILMKRFRKESAVMAVNIRRRKL
jgi:hypothetical protein